MAKPNYDQVRREEMRLVKVPYGFFRVNREFSKEVCEECTKDIEDGIKYKKNKKRVCRTCFFKPA